MAPAGTGRRWWDRKGRSDGDDSGPGAFGREAGAAAAGREPDPDPAGASAPETASSGVAAVSGPGVELGGSARVPNSPAGTCSQMRPGGQEASLAVCPQPGAVIVSGKAVRTHATRLQRIGRLLQSAPKLPRTPRKQTLVGSSAGTGPTGVPPRRTPTRGIVPRAPVCCAHPTLSCLKGPSRVVASGGNHHPQDRPRSASVGRTPLGVCAGRTANRGWGDGR